MTPPEPPSRTSPPRPGRSHPERLAVLAALRPVVTLLGRVVGPHVEVVLHDLTQPEHSVLAIANGHLSGRAEGSSILSGPKDDIAFAAALREVRTPAGAHHSVIDDYPTLTRDGTPLHSATVVYRDADGVPFAALCINADLRLLHQVRQWLDAMLPASPGAAVGGAAASPTAPAREPGNPPPATPRVESSVQGVVTDALRQLGKPVAELDRDERKVIVQTLMQQGLFVIRGGVEQAAQALGVSRYTIYNDAKALRQQLVENTAPLPRHSD